MTIQELRAKKVELAKVIREMADLVNAESRDFTGDEQHKWETVNAEYNVVLRKIEAHERVAELDAHEADPEARDNLGREEIDPREQRTNGRGRLDTPGRPGRAQAAERRDLAVLAWMAVQSEVDATPEQRDAARELGVNPHRESLGVGLLTTGEVRQLRRQLEAERRAQTVGTDSEGGYTLPEGFVNNLERAQLEFGGMFAVATILRTATGSDLPWPTVDDTSNTGELLAESATLNEQDVAFGVLTLQAFKYSSKLVRVSAELMQDSAFNMAAELGSMLGERLARIQNTHFTTGDASSKPNGIVTASALGKTTASTTAVVADELFDLVHSVDPAYRRQGCGFMMHDGLLLMVRKLVDANDQYLWMPGLAAGQPDQILGFPYTINQDMDGVPAATDKVMLFGLLSKYMIRQVAGIRMRRLVERYAEYDQEGFCGFMRADGDLLDAGTNPVKHLIMAAS